MDKNTPVIDIPKKVGRPNFEFTPKILEQVKTMASYMCTKAEIGKIIGCSESTIKLKSSIMAMWLGKVYLGQTDKIQNADDNVPLPIYDIIEHEEPKEIEFKEVQNDTIPK